MTTSDSFRLVGVALWHLAAVAVVVILPAQLWTGKPFWNLSGNFLLEVQLAAAAYALTASISVIRILFGRSSTAIDLLVCSMLLGMAAAVLVFWVEGPFSTAILGLSVVLSLALMAGSRVVAFDPTNGLASTALVGLIAASAFLAGRPIDVRQRQPDDSDRFERTAYYPVRLRYHDGLVPESERRPGGAIDRLGDAYVAVTGAGAFYRLTYRDDAGRVSGTRLPIPSPANFDTFDAAASPTVIRDYFRVIDVLGRRTDAGWDLYASHHYWFDSQSCVVLRVSRIRLEDKRLTPAPTGSGWTKIFDTTPCLDLPLDSRGKPFAGHEAGGRMAWVGGDEMILTSGDQEHDGWYKPIAAAQDDTYLYGKTILLNVVTGDNEIFTKGNRNPQGLLVDDDGRIWSTEHGPEGGDELNLLERDVNYGWPYETYGTDYGRYEWPVATQPAGDRQYRQPVFSWVPSIGISNLIRVNDGRFTRWAGNLLVTSLKSRHLYRVEMRDDHVVYVEPINVRRRIRDIITGPDGSIWLWGEEGNLVTVSIAESQGRGATLFTECTGCHSTGVLSGGLGPTLLHVVNRPVASREDYSAYSPALRAVGGNWSRKRLDEFLADPQAFAPGNTMAYPGIADPDDRRMLIEYLSNTGVN